MAGTTTRTRRRRRPHPGTSSPGEAEQDGPVLGLVHLGRPPWPTFDPFLFCVHHLDHYPQGNDAMGPDASLSGRDLGMDFAGIDGWRMYHGEVVPGFPRHPHRGFETITVTRTGLVDHSDSLGATARYGEGDVQWMTAGSGIVHSEMFPLVQRDAPNRAELFQLWLNLPSDGKMADPDFTMFWRDEVPRLDVVDESGRRTVVVVVAGSIGDARPPAPPPASWAARDEAEVAVWSLSMEPGATWSLPTPSDGVDRTIYLFEGESIIVADEAGRQHEVAGPRGIRLRGGAHVTVRNGPTDSELLVLQGRPIGEPVAHHGPFVMNTREELQQAFNDYRRTGFGGWPWPSDGPVHARDEGRFAIHADGHREDAPA